MRGLYDACSLEDVLAGADEDYEALAHRAILYYASISARFPQSFEGRTERFADREEKLESQLLPMLRAANERPTLQRLMATAEQFIETRVLPHAAAEREHLRFFVDGDYRPEPLFPDAQMATAARQSPAAP